MNKIEYIRNVESRARTTSVYAKNNDLKSSGKREVVYSVRVGTRSE